MKRFHPLTFLAILVFAALGAYCFTQEPAPAPATAPAPAKALPAAQTSGGMPLMQALKERKTTRSFADKKIPDQVLANLLWAAAGVNRPDSGKRTAPSAMNWQEIDVYVAAADGLFLYNGKEQKLVPILPDDIRAQTGGQPFVKDAPINLIYVADGAKMGQASDADKALYSAADTGFIAQNVYLFCASEALGAVVRGGIDRENLAKTMRLRPEQKIILAQTVGYPK